MNLQQLLDYINYIANKDQFGNTLSPKEYNTLLPIVSFKYFKKKYGIPEQFKAGMPFSAEAYEITQSIIDSISQFKVVMGEDTGMLLIDNSGKANIPEDYLHVSSAYLKDITNTGNCSVGTGYNAIEFLTDAEFVERLGSSINPPSRDYPIVTQRSNYFQFMPKNIQYINFTYLRKPRTPVYDYQIINDAYVYQPLTSVELEFEETDIIDIASILLSEIGINLREDRLKIFADQMKKEGI